MFKLIQQAYNKVMSPIYRLMSPILIIPGLSDRIQRLEDEMDGLTKSGLTNEAVKVSRELTKLQRRYDLCIGDRNQPKAA